MGKLALQADRWYNKLIKSFDPCDATNIQRSEHNLYKRLRHGYSTPVYLILQPDPLCFPLFRLGREAVMPAPKDPQRYEEWKRNLSSSHKGQMPGNKGTKHTPEAKAKMSESAKGRTLSLDARAKVSEALRGRKRKPFSEEHKAKISASKKGHKYPDAKGHSQSPETRAKIGAATKERHARAGGDFLSPEARARCTEAAKRNPPSDRARAASSAARKGKPGTPHTDEAKARISIANSKPNPKKSVARKGKKHTPESIAKMAEATRTHYAAMSPEEQGAFNEKRLKAVGNSNTDLEVYVASQLDRFDIVYEQQKRVGRYVVDFLFPGENLVWEINGCYWHGCEKCGYDSDKHIERRESDSKRTAFLNSRGYTVAILWQHDLIVPMRSGE